MRKLNYEKRKLIEVLKKSGVSNTEIAKRLNVTKSTITRELKNGLTKDGTYSAMVAQLKL